MGVVLLVEFFPWFCVDFLEDINDGSSHTYSYNKDWIVHYIFRVTGRYFQINMYFGL